MSLKIGFGRSCITPEESVPLAGYGNTSKRMSSSVLDDLYATCIAFSDNNEYPVLLFTLDMLHANDVCTNEIRKAITECTGIPGCYVMIAHTHTHSAPDMYNREKESIPRYLKLLVQRAVDAAVQALGDLVEAKLYAGVRAMQRNMNAVRTYIKDESVPGGLRAAGEPDRRMQLIKIVRDGKKDILLMNWQAHPCMTGGSKVTNISADYIGRIRNLMESKCDSLFAFFQGASGDLVVRSKIPGERITNDCDIYAVLLYEWTMHLYDELTPVSGDGVHMLEVTKQIPIDHSDDHRIEDARKVNKFWLEKFDYAQCTKYANTLGMNSVYHASGIMLRERLGESADMTLNAFRVGDLAFACAPFEMFSINGSQIKDKSPFAVTFVVTSCNSLHGYLAADHIFDIGSYEVDSRRYPRGTAESVAEAFGKMLHQLKELY